ncbi:DNA repair protein brc-2 [Caenorhabditis elegans]|uniref:DNA repair protein brc-2 n=1 Tax=Caenorhabditis elegans TaxID=6239 RepID=BRC2_CAEEL|nr:DNA repair protein brc-2 [Caenorhabditis elegans]G5EG86.1 RecName: Full=DNA repair protein brc-2 [Caenorhabditis elegans]AAR98640.1 potential BRCA2-like protein (44.7 kD) (3H990) [Caenorhabditis elegans]CCD72025.1 DNA repair protein brc-2 [Caenorhabditis elegans]|eukprot:NP_498502.3 DNA repair protein brc-2 [Caenorhabditis elegans]
MGDSSKKVKDSFDTISEPDSFDEPKGVPISMEPVFSTAAGIRIDVKQESIDKSKKMLNSDLKSKSSSKGGFSSPLVRKNNGSSAFVSPFRREGTSSTTTKRPASGGFEDFEAPPAKKSTSSSSKKSKKHSKKEKKKEFKEIHADVLRVSRIYEKDKFRIILQESSSTPLILATCSYNRGSDIKFGDRIHVDAEVCKKSSSGDVTEIYIDRVLKNKENGAKSGIRRHSIAKKPFCIKPRFIHELSDTKIKKTVVQVNLLDLNLDFYAGCSKCKHSLPEAANQCEFCKDSQGKSELSMYSRVRVMDFSGQMFINVTTKNMKKLLDLLGYEGFDNWFRFKDPQERQNYVFRPVMVEIEKSNDEWECTDVAEVDWKDFGSYLKHKEDKKKRRSKKKHP